MENLLIKHDEFLSHEIIGGWEDNLISNQMAWAKPEYTREQVNKAGNILLGLKPSNNLSIEASFTIINNWRTSHNFPLNTFQNRLRKKANEIDDSSIVVQRIKRLHSITKKLERYPDMRLSQIQDIGGCRAIMKNIKQVEKLVETYKHKSGGTKHKLASEHDYIACPKKSGYRGVHLVYKYQSDKNHTYKDLKIEIQIRTLTQHAWATAVETVGTFLQQSLKSSQGEKDWLRFFALMSSYMALKEKKAIVPFTPESADELKQEIIRYEKKLNAIEHLNTYRISLQSLDDVNADINDAHYYILELDISNKKIIVSPYMQKELPKASADYMKLERNNFGNKDIVLVAAESLNMLKKAYPNYYLDTELFLKLVKTAIK